MGHEPQLMLGLGIDAVLLAVVATGAWMPCATSERKNLVWAEVLTAEVSHTPGPDCFRQSGPVLGEPPGLRTGGAGTTLAA